MTYCEDRGGGTAFALYLARPPEYRWSQVDVVCLGPDDGILPTVDIGAAAAQAFANVDLPDTAVVVQPPDGALVNVPALFAAPTPQAQPDAVSVSLGGITLTLTITPSVAGYVWSFGDGTTRSTSTGGRSYSGGSVPPEGAGDPYVSHTYRSAGTRTVTLTTTWRGTYVFGGGAPQTIEQTRALQSSAQVDIKTARSELVAG